MIIPHDSDVKLTPRSVLDPIDAFWPDGIDLDPCGDTNSLVGARNTIVPPDDGLSVDWSWAKTIWLNPPYSREQVPKWLQKMTDAQCSGAEGLALLKHDHTTEWWRKYVRPRARCEWGRRVSFICPQGESAIFPSTLVYFGNEPERFYFKFRDYGQIVA